MGIHIVLMEPEIPQNTGNIVRTCAVTVSSLHLIRPLGFSIDDRYLKRAGLDYWPMANVRVHDSYEAFKQEIDNMPCYYFTTKAKRLYTQVDYPKECALVFGKETAGLPRNILEENAQHCVRLPMKEGLRSLNLSNAVSIAVYEALRQGGFAGME
ncbi:MAG: tRNA (cytidine(34)-2'-O)-methyltransferase [Christensenellales bacterium]|jgi:tRNA (cytidine/uridine-2'-O-)-methyltransferase